MKDIKKVKEDKEEELLNKENVQYVSIGNKYKDGKDTGEESVVIGVKKKKKEEELSDKEIVPSKIDRFKTDVQEVGEIRAPPKEREMGIVQKIKDFFSPFSTNHKDKYRPFPLGVSIGHEDITAGTSSFILVDRETADEFPASNNHVLAKSNKGDPGDPIIQPGLIDGGGSDTKVGELENYIKIKDGVKVDLAWFKASEKYDNRVLGVEGKIGSVYSPKVNDELIKSGRTTGVTKGKVKQKQASIKVKYPHETVLLKDQIIVDDFSEGGDSGSAVFYKEGNILHPSGLLFAGSDRITVVNDIDNVIKESGMNIKTESGNDDNGNDDNDNGDDGNSDDDEMKNILKSLIEILRKLLDKLQDTLD